MAKKSSTKNKDVLKGTNVADVLTVKHSQVTVNAGKGNDTINVTKGSKHNIYGEAGKDTITIGAKAGTGMKVYGDDAKGKLTGNDTFNINGGKKNYFYGGKGADIFNIYGGTTNHIYGGLGRDIIIVNGNRNYVSGEQGADTIIISGSYNYIYGDLRKSDNRKSVYGKTNKIILNKGMHNTIFGGDYKGWDYREKCKITVNGGSKNDIVASDYKDTIIINGGSKNTINAREGNDTITINGGNNYKGVYKHWLNKINADIDASYGNDTIIVKAGNNNRIVGWNGNDTIIVQGGNNNEIYADDWPVVEGRKTKLHLAASPGNDTITIKGGKNNKIFSGDGKDKIIIKGGSNNVIGNGYAVDFTAIEENSCCKVSVEGGSYNNISVGNLYNSNNRVEVKAGSHNKIYCDGSIVVTGGNYNKIYGSDINGTLTKAIGNHVEAYNGSSFKLDNCENSSIYGFKTVTVFGGVNNTIGDLDGDVELSSKAKNSKITVNGAKNTKIDCGDGNNTVTITNSTNNSIKTGSGSDTVLITGGSNKAIDLDGRNNKLTITNSNNTGLEISAWSGSANQIEIVGGINDNMTINGNGKITVSNAGKNNKIECFDENDIIVINGGNGGFINGGLGSDKITVNNGKNYKIYAHEWTGGWSSTKYDDTNEIYLNNGENTTIYCGEVDYDTNHVHNTIDIKGGKNNKVFLGEGNVDVDISVDWADDIEAFTIDADENGLNYGNYGVYNIVIKNAKSSDFTSHYNYKEVVEEASWYIEEDRIYMTDSLDNQIIINGWRQLQDCTINLRFDDRTLTNNDLFSIVQKDSGY